MESKALRLHQVLALEGGIKTRSERELADAHHGLKKPELLNGFSTVYHTKSEDGEKRPPETKLVQVKVEDAISTTAKVLRHLFDITAQKDYANTGAKADVVLHGEVLLKDCPVLHLLWLSNQLTFLHAFVSQLPTLSAAERWIHDPANSMYRTEEEWVNTTKKEPKVITLAPATDKHPAQAQLVHEDIVVGTKNTTKFSGCIPTARKTQLIERVEQLQTAVKLAKEMANTGDAPKVEYGQKVMDFLFSK